MHAPYNSFITHVLLWDVLAIGNKDGLLTLSGPLYLGAIVASSQFMIWLIRTSLAFYASANEVAGGIMFPGCLCVHDAQVLS